MRKKTLLMAGGIMATGITAALYLTTLKANNPTTMDLKKFTIEENKIKTNPNINAKDYYFMLNTTGTDYNAGIGMNLIHNNDTTKMYTDQLGAIAFKAYPEDKVEFYTKENTNKFHNLELLLTDKNYNILVVDPKTNKLDITSEAETYAMK